MVGNDGPAHLSKKWNHYGYFGSYIQTKVFQKKKLDPKNVLFSTILSYSRMMIYKLAKS